MKHTPTLLGTRHRCIQGHTHSIKQVWACYHHRLHVTKKTQRILKKYVIMVIVNVIAQYWLWMNRHCLDMCSVFPTLPSMIDYCHTILTLLCISGETYPLTLWWTQVRFNLQQKNTASRRNPFHNMEILLSHNSWWCIMHLWVHSICLEELHILKIRLIGALVESSREAPYHYHVCAVAMTLEPGG